MGNKYYWARNEGKDINHLVVASREQNGLYYLKTACGKEIFINNRDCGSTNHCKRCREYIEKHKDDYACKDAYIRFTYKEG